MLQTELENWAIAAAPYFRETYGLAGNFALDAARLYIALWAHGLQPRITSGFRDPRKQKAMQEAWDRGDRQGLRARPATDSLHTKTTFLGGAAATAIDIASADDARAAAVASALGIGAGWYFTSRDPGHYYSLKA